jgi:hypothetical protein
VSNYVPKGMLPMRPLSVETASQPSVLERMQRYTEPDGDCIVWIGMRRPKGYGAISIGGRFFQAHRVAWVIANGQEIPDGMVICHSCDNRPCVNPAHLFVGTVADNARDMSEKGRAKGGPKPREVCKRGLHAYTPDNIVIASGHRRCLACKKEAVNAYGRARRKREREARESGAAA